MNNPLQKAQPIIKLNIVQLMNKNIEKVQSEVNFCYPKNSLEISRVHSSLCSIGETVNPMKKIIVSITANAIIDEAIKKHPEKNLEEIKDICVDMKAPSILVYLEKTIERIKADKNFAYPNNFFDDSRGHTSLQMITGLCRGYNYSAETLMPSLEENGASVSFNVSLKNILDLVNVESSYNYAYTNSTLEESKVHAALQMLITNTSFFNNIFECVSVHKDAHVIVQEQFVTILDNFKKETAQLQIILGKAYPNNNLNIDVAHSVLNSFIHSYRSFKKQYSHDLDLLNSLVSHHKVIQTDQKEYSDAPIKEPIPSIVKIRKLL
jgi:hypothetical protein